MAIQPAANGPREITLKDRLSRLTFVQACKLLGPDGARLIRSGGGWEINIDEQVYLGEDLFRLRLDGAVVTITPISSARERLHWNCNRCHRACEHVGAAFSLVLEEKTALGLAMPPPERIPIESLGEEELIARAVAERQERSRTERMTVRSAVPNVLWTDYLVTNAVSGKTYRVALRGWEPGDSYCSCPDFRKNTLGICKHIFAVQRSAKRRFPPAARRRPYVQKNVAVHVHYGKDCELRVLVPDELEAPLARVVRPLARGAVQDVGDLVKRIGQLQALGHDVTVYPDAEELIDRRLFQDRIESLVAQIRRDAGRHPLRTTLLKVELLPYQLDGIAFAVGAGRAILADDMGLGKTLQTLTWLAWMRGGAAPAQNVDVTPASRETQSPQVAGDGMSPEPSVTRASHPPSLVVCPKSVMDNWHAEAARFFPTLAVRVWRANELKSLAGQLASADLHVLNYSQLRQVADDLARADFHAVILDEGQYIKNPSSQTAQVARRLRATHRLILSGTPIENRLLDLWSLMSFAMPGALGNRAEFARLYDSKSDPFARQRLSARVRPFLIRRTKSQVARDLPDRVEEDLFCELEGEQKTLYRAELKRAQAMLLGIKTAAALNKERFNFLTSLLRLRQICCHPKLVKPDSKAASAKVEALLETLEPLMDEGEKVLVFSQFVELLDLLHGAIEERGWRQWYLAGDTENRGDLVSEFQSADGAGVFLISLKAGGFGLNLTAASYVVLFDPWWNPAVEAQAIDRTHRIGQDRKVIAYRLLIKDSIEEKIRTLQKQKKALAEDVLGEEKFAQGLSLDDLRYLLAE